MFRNGADRRWRGESSPAYSETLAFPNVPRDIHRLSPDAKIIYLVREPFARFKSVWTQTLSTGHWAEEKLFPMKMPRAYRDAVLTYPTFLGGCRYWTNLSNFRAYFRDDAIKVILFETLVADTPATIRDVFAFLDVDRNAPINLHGANLNSSAGKAIYRPWSKRFGRLLPGSVKNLVPDALRLKLRAMVNRLPTPKFDHTDLTIEEVRKIRAILNPEVRALYDYAGIKGDPWHFFDMPEGTGHSPHAKCRSLPAARTGRA